MNNEWELPQADMLADDIFGNQKEWYSKDTVTSLLASERADWLRSEIEKLEGKLAEALERPMRHFNGNENYDYNEGYANALASIITRYKEELLELDKTNGF